MHNFFKYPAEMQKFTENPVPVSCGTRNQIFTGFLHFSRISEEVTDGFRSGSGSKVNQFVCPDICRHATFYPNPSTRFWV